MAGGPIRVQDGLAPWRLCPPRSLSESLRPYTFLIALVIWLLWHELCLMTTTLQVGPELHRGKAGRQAARVVKCLPGHQKRVPKLWLFAVGVNIFSKLSVGVYERVWMIGQGVTLPPTL